MSFEIGYRPEELHQLRHASNTVLKEILVGHNMDFTGKTAMSEFFIIMTAYTLHNPEFCKPQIFWTLWMAAFYTLSYATIVYRKRQQVATLLGLT